MKKRMIVFAVVLMGASMCQLEGAEPFPTPPGMPAAPPATGTKDTPAPVPSPAPLAGAPVTANATPAAPTMPATPAAPAASNPLAPVGPPASVVHGTATPASVTVSSGSTAIPAPATPPAPKPAASDAPATEEEKVMSIDAPPLFAATATVGATEQKELYAKSADDEAKAQEALTALEKIKSDRLDSYLSFDADLDSVYDSSGLSKGDASTQLSQIKDHLAANIESKTAADTAAQALVTQQSALLDKLDAGIKDLQEKEKGIVEAIKVLSDYVLGLGDAVVKISSQRNELDGVLEPTVAAATYKDIQSAAEKVVAAQTAVVGASGQAKAVDDAMDAGKKQVAVVKGLLDELKKKSVNLDDVLKKLPPITVPAAVPQPSVEAVTAPDAGEKEAPVDAVAADGKKKTKKSGLTASSLRKMVRGTVFEAPYEVFSAIFEAAARLCAPVIIAACYIWESISAWFTHVFGMNDLLQRPAVSAETSVQDPVLDRIRHERNQSHEKVQELIAQRELIDMKEALLDRLEAERVMQLDTKERLKEEISRAYKRKERELSWFELFKRLAWKSYATLRRVVIKTTSWWCGDAPARRDASQAGRGEEKKEPDMPAALSTAAAPVKKSGELK